MGQGNFFAASAEDAHVGEILATRVQRAVVAVAVGLGALFLFDFNIPPEQRVPIELVRLALIAVYGAAYLAVRTEWGCRNAAVIGVFALGALGWASAFSGVIVRDGDLSLSIVELSLLATAAFYPWSMAAQGWSIAVALPAVAYEAATVGDGSLLLGFPMATLLVAAGFSLYLVRELERHRANLERTLAAIKERGSTFREILSSAPEAILIRGRDDDRILAVNDAFIALTGYAREELVGRTVDEVGYWARPGERASALAGIHEKGSVTDAPADYRRKDGSIVTVAFAARTIIIDDAAYVIAFVRDISERRNLERMRQEVVAMLSHDVKNPLGAILGYTDELRDEIAEPSEDVQKMLNRITANARSAVALADNFVQAAKIESGEQELHVRSTSLDELVTQVLHTAEGLARVRDLRVIHRKLGSAPPVLLDPGLMERAIGNLVGNAIKFAPPGSAVEIETDVAGGSAVLRVRDRGPGIPPEARSKLFQRFRRGPSGRLDGSGLGLFIVRSVVEAHGGRVGVDCPQDGGSVFEIAIPLAAGGQREQETSS